MLILSNTQNQLMGIQARSPFLIKLVLAELMKRPPSEQQVYKYPASRAQLVYACGPQEQPMLSHLTGLSTVLGLLPNSPPLMIDHDP